MRLSQKSVRLAITAASCALVWLAPAPARAAFDFSPITAELAPSGAKASASFTVQNTTDRKTPVQIYVVPREPDAEGNEKYGNGVDSDDRFQVFPPQFILNPRERRTVRVNWVGPTNVTKELAFRIISEELPINVDEPNRTYKKPVGSVMVANKYIGSLYISPIGVQPKLTATAGPSEDKEPKLKLEITNSGSGHFVLNKTKVTVASGTSKAEIPSDDLKKLINQNVLAGKTRRFLLPWPKSLPVGPVKVNLETLPD